MFSVKHEIWCLPIPTILVIRGSQREVSHRCPQEKPWGRAGKRTMSYLDNVCVETCNTCQLSRVGKNDTSFVCAHPPVCYKPVVDPFCRINPWIHCKSVHVVSMPYQLCYSELSMLGTVDWGSEVSAVLLLCVHVGVRVSWRQHVSFPLLTCIVSLQLSCQKSTALTCLPYELRRGGFRPGYPPDYCMKDQEGLWGTIFTEEQKWSNFPTQTFFFPLPLRN